jgi:hypothetical protein
MVSRHEMHSCWGRDRFIRNGNMPLAMTREHLNELLRKVATLREDDPEFMVASRELSDYYTMREEMANLGFRSKWAGILEIRKN